MRTQNQQVPVMPAARRKEPTTLGGAQGAQYDHHDDRGVEWIAIDRLNPYAGNARSHSGRQIKLIARSIARFGFNNPILIDSSNTIIAGHGRVAAARQLGHVAVPAVRITHLDDAARRAYMIADNRLAELADWNRQTLVIELQALVETGFEVEITGFAIPEIDLKLDEAAVAAADPLSAEDEIPQQCGVTTVCRPGDLWRLGDHRLLCGDARNPTAYQQLLNSKKADAVFTDPPYNVPIEGHVCGLGTIKHRDFAMAAGEMSFAEFSGFLKQTLGNAATASRNGAVHFVCMDWRHLQEAYSAGTAIYSNLLNLCVWNKDNGGMGSLYRSKHELVLVLKVGNAPHINNVELGRHGRNRTNVWNYPGANSFRADRLNDLAAHPTIKPAALVCDAILDVTRRRDLVLDPFLGSGTTIIAAEKTGRRAHGIEVEPRYVDVAIRRWQKYTGKNAVLSGSRLTFEQREDSIATAPISPKGAAHG
jgi:DNA modification methylase